jgi:hypothetical protein
MNPDPYIPFAIENGKLYAIGSKGDKYEIRLESPDGQEAFCACEGFKWSNTDARRDARPHRAIHDCRHLQAARERANAVHVSPRFRLYHQPSNRVLADKFRSIESFGALIDPALTPLSFPPHEMEIQRFDESKQEWVFVRMTGEPPPVVEIHDPQKGGIPVWDDKPDYYSEPMMLVHREPKETAAPRKSRKKEPPPEPPKEEGPKNQEFYCRSCESISPAVKWIDDKCPACGRDYEYKGSGD